MNTGEDLVQRCSLPQSNFNAIILSYDDFPRNLGYVFTLEAQREIVALLLLGDFRVEHPSSNHIREVLCFAHDVRIVERALRDKILIDHETGFPSGQIGKIDRLGVWSLMRMHQFDMQGTRIRGRFRIDTLRTARTIAQRILTQRLRWIFRGGRNRRHLINYMRIRIGRVKMKDGIGGYDR